jgi:calcineurin-like phosphoesterase family protein
VTRYLLADAHFGDSEVMEYTARPFGSVAEMDDALLEGWNDVVGPDDEVVFVGDFAVPSEPTTVRRWLNRVNGNVVFVVGDHDPGARRSHAVRTRAAYEFRAGGHRFHCVHHPDDAPPDRDGWLVHGHVHDMRPDEYPFIDPDARRVNVGVELLGYEPLPADELVGYVERGEQLRERPE